MQTCYKHTQTKAQTFTVCTQTHTHTVWHACQPAETVIS